VTVHVDAVVVAAAAATSAAAVAATSITTGTEAKGSAAVSSEAAQKQVTQQKERLRLLNLVANTQQYFNQREAELAQQWRQLRQERETGLATLREALALVGVALPYTQLRTEIPAATATATATAPAAAAAAMMADDDSKHVNEDNDASTATTQSQNNGDSIGRHDEQQQQQQKKQQPKRQQHRHCHHQHHAGGASLCQHTNRSRHIVPAPDVKQYMTKRAREQLASAQAANNRRRSAHSELVHEARHRVGYAAASACAKQQCQAWAPRRSDARLHTTYSK
jgi:hypothetical protein